MAGHFKKRLEQQILEKLTDLVASEIRDPRVQDMVFTAVQLNKDFSVAKVYYMPPMGGDAYELAGGLHKSAGFLRGAVGRSLRLREAPELRFELDDSLERVNRLDEVIEESREEE
jgi:ribosome-binding factor A